jgi:ribosomal protein L18E
MRKIPAVYNETVVFVEYNKKKKRNVCLSKIEGYLYENDFVIIFKEILNFILEKKKD